MNAPAEDHRPGIVLNAFDTPFNKRDYVAPSDSGGRATSSTARIFRPAATGCSAWSRTGPRRLRHENHLAAATVDFIILHGRFSGHGQPAAWAVADIVRMQGDILAEHRDVIQDEATRAQSRSGLPIFGDRFPD